MDSVALALFRFFSRTRQKAGAAVRAPGAAPHPHPHPHECNYVQIGKPPYPIQNDFAHELSLWVGAYLCFQLRFFVSIWQLLLFIKLKSRVVACHVWNDTFHE